MKVTALVRAQNPCATLALSVNETDTATEPTQQPYPEKTSVVVLQAPQGDVCFSSRSRTGYREERELPLTHKGDIGR